MFKYIFSLCLVVSALDNQSAHQIRRADVVSPVVDPSSELLSVWQDVSSQFGIPAGRGSSVVRMATITPDSREKKLLKLLGVNRRILDQVRSGTPHRTTIVTTPGGGITALVGHNSGLEDSSSEDEDFVPERFAPEYFFVVITQR